ncbi:uncharacterized protein LOC132565640 [Ylistrum balloti]|uniref:uncharacterized protein LOC132565640 n=1 Tax=Ylistrum balloti TaxID=509963 RepID=UPI002905E65D|nr:uncharacterized protein LOC132565640 [Ylistrum balloti]
MDPNGNLFQRIQQKIKDGKKGEDYDGAKRLTSSGLCQKSSEATHTSKSAEEMQGTSNGNDSVIIIPDTPSPVFSRFVGKRGKPTQGKQFTTDGHKETSDDRQEPTNSKFKWSTKCQRAESNLPSKSRLPRAPVLTPEKHSSPWKQNQFEENSNNASSESTKIVPSMRSKFLDAKTKVALSPGKVKISPYVPSHGIHFKTALQEMMEKKQDKFRNESKHPNQTTEQSARKPSHTSSSSGLHKNHHDLSSHTESCHHVDRNCARVNHRHYVKPSLKLSIDQKKDPETHHNREAASNAGRRKCEASSSPARSKRARLDSRVHSKSLYPVYDTWPSDSSDSEDSEFDPISSQTLKEMIDCSCEPQTDDTLSAVPHVSPTKGQGHFHRHRDEAKRCANHTFTTHTKPHLTHVSSLHDITSSRSSNHNPQGHQVESQSLGAHRKQEKLDGNKTKHLNTKSVKSDQSEKMSDWFDDGFSRMAESDWSPTVREESRSHSRKMATERSRSIQHTTEGRSHKNKRTNPSPRKDQGCTPVLRQQDGCPGQPIICDNVEESTPCQSQIDQVEGDEELAKKLQEQMDMEFALSLQNLENQPPVFGAGVFPHHDMASPTPVAYNRGPMAVGQGRWATAQRGRATSRYPDLDEVEALLHDLDEPEEHLLQHSPQGRPMTRNGVRTQTGQHFLDDIAHLNHSLLSMLEGGNSVMSPPVARHSRSRRRGQRRNAAPRGFDVGSSVDGNDYEDLLSLAEMLGDVKNKGLTEAQSSRLPIRTYQANSEKQESEDCLICMCEYDQNDRLKMLPCFHEFHAQCIDKWIKGNASCPVCRVEVKLT